MKVSSDNPFIFWGSLIEVPNALADLRFHPVPNPNAPVVEEFLNYENYEQFEELMERPSFAQLVRLPKNKDIVHRIVKNTMHLSNEEIDKRKKILKEIIRKYRFLLNYLAYEEKHTPLHERKVHVDLVKFLVNQGAQIYMITKTYEFTFPHIAAMTYSPEHFHELVKFLLDMEYADLLKSRNVQGITPIQVAVCNLEVKEETISMCLQHPDLKLNINDVDNDDNNILSYAVMGRRSEAYLKLLMKFGAVCTGNVAGYHPIHHAACLGNIEAINLFGSADNLKLEATGGLTPLHLMFKYGLRDFHKVVEAILSKFNEAVLIPDDEGRTPLWWAKNGPLKAIVEPKTIELMQKYMSKAKRQLGSGSNGDIRGEDETGTEGDWDYEDDEDFDDEPELANAETQTDYGFYDVMYNLVSQSVQRSEALMRQFYRIPSQNQYQ